MKKPTFEQEGRFAAVIEALRDEPNCRHRASDPAVYAWLGEPPDDPAADARAQAEFALSTRVRGARFHARPVDPGT